MELFDSIIRKRRHIVCNQKDLINILSVINQHKIYDITIGNCAWADDTSKWFIHFDTSNKRWSSIVNELNIIRVWNNGGVPVKGEGVYSTD